MAAARVGAGAGDRGLGILFLPFRLLSASPPPPFPAATPLSLLKSHLNRYSFRNSFTKSNAGGFPRVASYLEFRFVKFAPASRKK